MSQFNKDLTVGDVVTTYHKGYWRVTHIERRFIDASMLRYNAYAGRTVGDELSSLIRYELVMDNAFRLTKSKKPKQQCCDASYCAKVDKAWVDEQARLAADGWARLKAMV